MINTKHMADHAVGNSVQSVGSAIDHGRLQRAAPGQCDARSSVTVVVDHLGTVYPLVVHSYVRAGRPKANTVPDDASVAEAWLDLRAPREDSCRGGRVGFTAPCSGLGGTAEDHGVAVRREVQQVRRQAGVLGEKLGDAGVFN